MKIFYEIQQEAMIRKLDFDNSKEFLSLVTSDPETKGGIVPDDVRIGLSIVSKKLLVIITIDEFDQVEDEETSRLFANTIKTLSDHAVDTTLILTGVATDATELIEHHQSIQRSLVYIRMPSMVPEELTEFVYKALRELNMTIGADALSQIIFFSIGFPHFTHSLGQTSAIQAIKKDHSNIEEEDVLDSLMDAINALDPIIHSTYHTATSSSQANLFQEVLLACALSETDEMGFFSPGNIREPLSKILGKDVTISSYLNILHGFCEEKRGVILEKTKIGNKQRFKFRFGDPLMRPYLIMNGYTKNLIPGLSPASSPIAPELPF